MQSLAVVGTGIAGMSAAYFLHKDFNLTVYEQNPYVGGHTHTVEVNHNDERVFIDTGFMVYNHVTYPNLVRLFRTLQVEEMDTSMSFSVQHIPSGLEFCGSGISGLFSQRKNLLNPRFVRMLLHINRFNSECLEVLDQSSFDDMTLSEYARLRGFGQDFLMKYLVPMSSAVWSTPPDEMLNFPVRTLVRFFHNHGFLGLHAQHQWKTVVDGSRMYRDKLIKPLRDRIYPGRAAVSIRRDGRHAVVVDSHGHSATYDKVIVASHADQSLRLLQKPTAAEHRLLSPFHYQTNVATLHTDELVMPKTRRAWSSWNYRLDLDGDGRAVPSTIYWMNSLQRVSDSQNFFISINGTELVRPEHTLYQISYEHPIFSVATAEAQKELDILNETGPIYYCGSYFRYGFHEDALWSSVRLCERILGRDVWS
jgi:predicted NAD/FAD-binding protein